ncbi:CoA ester lyase [Mycolicibacterium sp. jd]|uniref:HpcH/HpaI aldolase/citrate lyase family protein n=1 Tax=unclassified Mycolicibacterium TaxID=2636767 RepID=UPI00351B7030
MNERIFAAIATARTFLFVPGSRPERFVKAQASGADIVVLDLEDAVAAPDKDAARSHVHAWLTSGGRAMVRINGFDSSHHQSDLAMIADTDAAVMLPKADSREACEMVASARARLCLVPLIETARGILHAQDICAATGVVRPALGHLDLAAELEIDPADRQALLFARSGIAFAAAAARVAPAIDGVTEVLDDSDRLESDVNHAWSLGLRGKLCIHPRQVEVVHGRMRPSPEEVEWAHRVVESAREDGSATSVDGQMVDAPVVARAFRILNAERR